MTAEGGARRLAGSAALAVLAATYLALVEDPSAGDVAVAVLAGAAALALARPLPRAELRSGGGPGPAEGLAALPGLVAAVAVDVARGSGWMFLVVLGRRSSRGNFVEVPAGERSRAAAVLTGYLVTLSPGTVLVDVRPRAGVLVFHVMGEDPEAFRERMDRFYRRHLRFLVP